MTEEDEDQSFSLKNALLIVLGNTEGDCISM